MAVTLTNLNSPTVGTIQRADITIAVLGGTGKEAVLATMRNLQQELDAKKAVLKADQKRVADSRANCRAIAAAAAGVKTLTDLQNLVHKYI